MFGSLWHEDKLLKADTLIPDQEKTGWRVQRLPNYEEAKREVLGVHENKKERVVEPAW